MTTFKAIVTGDIEAFRLVKLSRNGEGHATISLAETGDIPNFYSTGKLVDGNLVRVSVKGLAVWRVEAGGDIKAGGTVKIGATTGKLMPSETDVVGYVTNEVKSGEIARLVPAASGASGGKGPTGDPGADGKPGADGNKGPDGDPGRTGDKGPDGNPGPDGNKGPDGDPA